MLLYTIQNTKSFIMFICNDIRAFKAKKTNSFSINALLQVNVPFIRKLCYSRLISAVTLYNNIWVFLAESRVVSKLVLELNVIFIRKPCFSQNQKLDLTVVHRLLHVNISFACLLVVQHVCGAADHQLILNSSRVDVSMIFSSNAVCRRLLLRD